MVALCANEFIPPSFISNGLINSTVSLSTLNRVDSCKLRKLFTPLLPVSITELIPGSAPLHCVSRYRMTLTILSALGAVWASCLSLWMKPRTCTLVTHATRPSRFDSPSP